MTKRAMAVYKTDKPKAVVKKKPQAKKFNIFKRIWIALNEKSPSLT